MPRLPIDYSKTIMYKLVCNDLSITECYVGHTTDFTKRKCCHKSCCYNEKRKEFNQQKYIFIRENGGWENWSMIMIEEYPCNNIIEAEKRERFWFEELNSKLNMCRPHRTIKEKKEYSNEYNKEYYQENKDKILEQVKEYYHENRDNYKEYKKSYYQENKDKILEKLKEHREENIDNYKEKDKKYYEKNKEKIIEQKKKYRQANKDKINAKRREKNALKKLKS